MRETLLLRMRTDELQVDVARPPAMPSEGAEQDSQSRADDLAVTGTDVASNRTKEEIRLSKKAKKKRKAIAKRKRIRAEKEARRERRLNRTKET